MTIDHKDISERLSTVQKLMQNQEDSTKREDIIQEEVEEWQTAILRLFNTDDGVYFGQKLVKASGIYHLNQDLNPTSLLVDKGRQDFYLRFIRPFLDPETLNKLERK